MSNSKLASDVRVSVDERLPHQSRSGQNRHNLQDFKARIMRASASARVLPSKEGGSSFAFIPPNVEIRVCHWPKL
ncbi:MAG: hypothetical protein H7255_02035 [Ramlibacter sp.]|nr:hypothetical protein [Ramlibacter sp.]